jgi:hypothetical protein
VPNSNWKKQSKMFNLKFSVMDFRELSESGANISITVKLDDLRAIFKEVAGELHQAPKAPATEEFLTRKEVLRLLKIDSSTLWC